MADAWHEISSDPTSLDLLEWRMSRLRAAQDSPILGRVEYLKGMAAGKRVLDVGVVDHFAGKRRWEGWLHGHLAIVAGYIVGIDILEGEIHKLQQKGYHVVAHNMERGALKNEDKFDIVVAGDVIEHMSDLGTLFAFARDSLVKDGRLIITTPHAFCLTRVARYWLRVPRENVDHICLCFPSGVAELAERHGMRLAKWRGIRRSDAAWVRLVSPLLPLAGLLGVNRDFCCESMLYECQLAH